MAVVTEAPPRSGTRMTMDEWTALPEDKVRRELIEGVLVVSPSPDDRHQVVVAGLHLALAAACPPGLRVLEGPLDIKVPSRTSGLQPDVLVLREQDRSSPGRLPLLVVEVLSPGTRGRDQVEKRRLYEAREVPSYWICDPDVPDLRVLELGNQGRYVETSYAAGEGEVEVDRPFPVRLVPTDLLR